MQPDTWQESTQYLEGIELFNHGYYWEAHEKWEGSWHAAGRAGAMGEFFRGLIKLAAAGLKVRQGKPGAVVRFGASAEEHFKEAQRQSNRPTMGGLAFSELIDFARFVADEGAGLEGCGTLPVEVVFERRLIPMGE